MFQDITHDELKMLIISAVSEAFQKFSPLPPGAEELEILLRKQLLTSKEVQKLYGISENTLRTMRSRGRGPEYSQDGAGPVYYTHKDIIEYIKKYRKKVYES